LHRLRLGLGFASVCNDIRREAGASPIHDGVGVIVDRQSVHVPYQVYKLPVFLFLSQLPLACSFGFSFEPSTRKDGVCDVNYLLEAEVSW